MIDTVLNLLFRCPHKRLTRPITPVIKSGQSHGGTYVVCLDCGKQFAYDAREMRMGKPIDRSDTVGVLPAEAPKRRSGKLRYALMAAVPAAVVLGVVLKGKKKTEAPAGEAPVVPDDRQQSVAEREQAMRREG